jgi:hypothetical protein
MAATARWLERFVRRSCERDDAIAFAEHRDDASTLRSLLELTAVLAPVARRRRSATRWRARCSTPSTRAAGSPTPASANSSTSSRCSSPTSPVAAQSCSAAVPAFRALVEGIDQAPKAGSKWVAALARLGAGAALADRDPAGGTR